MNRRVGGELPFPICPLNDAHYSKAVIYRVKRASLGGVIRPDAASARDRRRRPARDLAATAETRAARAPAPVYNTPATAWGGRMGEENFEDALTPWSTLTDVSVARVRPLGHAVDARLAIPGSFEDLKPRMFAISNPAVEHLNPINCLDILFSGDVDVEQRG